MFDFIKIIFIRPLIDLVNASNYKKCVSLTNHKCKIQPTIITVNYPCIIDSC